MKDKPSLKEFALTHPLKRGPKCSTCALPQDVMTEIRMARHANLSFAIIADWLVKLGYADSNAYKLSRHFRDHEKKD